MDLDVTTNKLNCNNLAAATPYACNTIVDLKLLVSKMKLFCMANKFRGRGKRDNINKNTHNTGL